MITEKGAIAFGSRKIDFFIRRSSRRRTISLFVDPHEGVFLRAPLGPSVDSLIKLVHSKADWIIKKQKQIEEVGEFLPKREFANGETFLYLGRQFRLKVLRLDKALSNKVAFTNGCFEISIDGEYTEVGKKRVMRKLLTNWYKRHARSVIFNRIKIYAKKLDLALVEFALANQSKRWGSCSHKGRVRFNWHIIMAPLSLIDYVVAHELSHLKQPNHSQEFWKLLGNVMPDYEIRRDRLRKEGHKFYF